MHQQRLRWLYQKQAHLQREIRRLERLTGRGTQEDLQDLGDTLKDIFGDTDWVGLGMAIADPFSVESIITFVQTAIEWIVNAIMGLVNAIQGVAKANEAIKDIRDKISIWDAAQGDLIDSVMGQINYKCDAFRAELMWNPNLYDPKTKMRGAPNPDMPLDKANKVVASLYDGLSKTFLKDLYDAKMNWLNSWDSFVNIKTGERYVPGTTPPH